MKIATWNVNSLKVRLPQVLAWLASHQPDVLLLQEIKMIDADFPSAAFLELGYFSYVSGQKAYNGVACLSKKEMHHPIVDLPDFQDPARRLMAIDFENIRIINVYIPNGEAPGSDKYQYKLRWLSAFISFLKDQLTHYPQICIGGDFNIAPHDLDVHDPKRWSGKILCSELERQAFFQMQALGLVDAFRAKHPEEKSFSWWDYRLKGFERNWGLRIDHLLVTPGLSIEACEIDRLPRAHERPSDHAPVVACLNGQAPSKS